MSDRVEVHIAQTPEEIQRFRAAATDLATYGHVAVIAATDPDYPDAIRTNVNVTAGAPCWLLAAKALRDVAAQLEQRHGESPCGLPRR